MTVYTLVDQHSYGKSLSSVNQVSICHFQYLCKKKPEGKTDTWDNCWFTHGIDGIIGTRISLCNVINIIVYRDEWDSCT